MEFQKKVQFQKKTPQKSINPYGESKFIQEITNDYIERLKK